MYDTDNAYPISGMVSSISEVIDKDLSDSTTSAYSTLYIELDAVFIIETMYCFLNNIEIHKHDICTHLEHVTMSVYSYIGCICHLVVYPIVLSSHLWARYQ